MPEIRELSDQDVNECLSVWGELIASYTYPIGGAWTAEKIAEELKEQHAVGVFDERGGVMQAFCLYRRPLVGLLEIMLLATRPRDHRRGAMGALVRSLIAELASDERIWLEVHAANLPAITLYESLGFMLCGERANYYSDGGKALLFEYKPLQ